MQTCARHASSSDKIQLRSVTRIVPVPRNVSRDTTGWMEARLQSNHRHLEPRESRFELTDELFPIDRSWWNGLDARVWYQLSDVTIRGVALPMKSIKSKPWPAEMRSAIIHAFRPIPRAQRTITCSKILGRFGGLLARRGKRRARDIVFADRSPPSVPRGREVCAWNAFPWREMVKKRKGKRDVS